MMAKRLRIHHSRVIKFDGVPYLRDYGKRIITGTTRFTGVYTRRLEIMVLLMILCSYLTRVQPAGFRVEGLTDAIAMDQSELILKKNRACKYYAFGCSWYNLDKEDEFQMLHRIQQVLKSWLIHGTTTRRWY